LNKHKKIQIANPQKLTVNEGCNKIYLLYVYGVRKKPVKILTYYMFRGSEKKTCKKF